MNTTVKRLTQEHFQQSMNLASFAFQYSLTSEQLEERKSSFIDPSQTRLGVFQDEQLCAQATLLDLQVYIAGQLFSMGGIAGVSTWPEHRRHGYVARLLQELLLHMRENGQSISMLHPFAFAFYRKFGWESYIDYKKYELGTEQLSSLLRKHQQFEQKGQIVRLDNWQPLQQVYEQYAERYNGMLHRSESWWKERIAVRKKGIYAAYQDHQGQVQGYIIYEATNRQMNIHEFIALTYEAEQQLLLYIAQHDSMVENVSWTAPCNDSFTFSLDNPRIKQEIIPYFMARIVDVTAFIAQFPFVQGDKDEQYRITIVDEQASWNDGLFILQIRMDGKATLNQETSVSAHEQLLAQEDISISIGALTSWLLYYQTWETLVRFNKVQASEPVLKRLQNRIPARITYLTDFF